jgi:hypothetical protein
MGLFGRFRRTSNRSRSRSRGRKSKRGPNIIAEPMEGEGQSEPQDPTTSTDPESTEGAEEGDVVLGVTNDDALVETENDGFPEGGAVENDKQSSEIEEEEPVVVESMEDPSFEILDAEEVPDEAAPTTADKSAGPAAVLGKDEAAVLQSFKAKAPRRSQGAVAARAAWLQNTAFVEPTDSSTDQLSPTSRQKASAKKAFWQGKAFHKESSTAPDPPRRKKIDVLQKKKWLEEAFTPNGGGNMDGAEETTPEKRKHTMGLLPASPSVSLSTESDGSGSRSPRPANRLLQVMASYEHQERPQTDIYLDKEEDPMEWAYEVWFQKRLLPWRPASFASGPVTVYQSLRTLQESPSGTATVASSSSSPQKSSFATPATSPSMRSVPEEQAQTFFADNKLIMAPSMEESNGTDLAISSSLQVEESESEEEATRTDLAASSSLQVAESESQEMATPDSSPERMPPEKETMLPSENMQLEGVQSSVSEMRAVSPAVSTTDETHTSVLDADPSTLSLTAKMESASPENVPEKRSSGPATVGSVPEDQPAKTPSLFDAGERDTKIILDKSHDPYEWAYNVWFQCGLLSWRPASANDTGAVRDTVRRGQFNPLLTRTSVDEVSTSAVVDLDTKLSMVSIAETASVDADSSTADIKPKDTSVDEVSTSAVVDLDTKLSMVSIAETASVDADSSTADIKSKDSGVSAMESMSRDTDEAVDGDDSPANPIQMGFDEEQNGNRSPSKLDLSPEFAASSATAANATLPPTSKATAFDPFQDPQISSSTSCDPVDDPHFSAYATWFEKGLLEWNPIEGIPSQQSGDLGSRPSADSWEDTVSDVSSPSTAEVAAPKGQKSVDEAEESVDFALTASYTATGGETLGTLETVDSRDPEIYHSSSTASQSSDIESTGGLDTDSKTIEEKEEEHIEKPLLPSKDEIGDQLPDELSNAEGGQTPVAPCIEIIDEEGTNATMKDFTHEYDWALWESRVGETTSTASILESGDGEELNSTWLTQKQSNESEPELFSGQESDLKGYGESSTPMSLAHGLAVVPSAVDDHFPPEFDTSTLVHSFSVNPTQGLGTESVTNAYDGRAESSAEKLNESLQNIFSESASSNDAKGNSFNDVKTSTPFTPADEASSLVVEDGPFEGLGEADESDREVHTLEEGDHHGSVGAILEPYFAATRDIGLQSSGSDQGAYDGEIIDETEGSNSGGLNESFPKLFGSDSAADVSNHMSPCVEAGVSVTSVEEASASAYEYSSGVHVDPQPALDGGDPASTLEPDNGQNEESVDSLPATDGYQVQEAPASSTEGPDSATSSVVDTSSPQIDTSNLQLSQARESEPNADNEHSGDNTEGSDGGIVFSPPRDLNNGANRNASSLVDSTRGPFNLAEATLRRSAFDSKVESDELLSTDNMGELRAVTVLRRSQEGSAEYQAGLSLVVDDDSASTDSSVKLNVYSQQYFANDNRYGDAHTHLSSDGESGVNLEPSIITHASSITGDDMSDAGALLFTDSFDDPGHTSNDTASFELLEEMMFHLVEAKPELMEPAKFSPPAPKRMAKAAESPSNDSDEEQGPGRRSPSPQERTLVSPPAPRQLTRAAVSPSLVSDGEQAPGRRSLSMTERVPVSPPVAVQELPESIATKPWESPSAINDGQQAHVRSPPHSLTVKADEDSRPKYSTGSIQKLRMKKVATASRAQYVMWLTKSRTANFRKTESTPKLSWFVVSERDTEEAETEKDAVFLLPFLSVPPWMENKFRLIQRLTVKHPLGVPASKRLSIVVESGEHAMADEEHHHWDEGDVRRSDKENERVFESLQKQRRERLSPSQRRGKSDAMERLRSAQTQQTNLMRRAFGKK